MNYLDMFKPMFSDEDLERNNEDIINQIKETCDTSLYELLFYKNYPLIIKIASRFEYDMDDLLQQSFLIMIRAAEKYDLGKGMFSTHFGHYLKHGLHDYVFTQRGISKRKKNDLYLYRRAVDDLTELLDRVPTTNEVAKHLDWGFSRTKSCEDLTNGILSLNYEVNDNEGNTTDLYNFVPDPSQEEQLERVAKSCDSEMLWNIIDDVLEKIESDILFLDLYELTNPEIAERLSISPKAVKQLKLTALNKLRKSGRIRAYFEIDEKRRERALYHNSFGYFENNRSSAIENYVVNEISQKNKLEKGLEVLDSNLSLKLKKRK